MVILLPSKSIPESPASPASDAPSSLSPGFGSAVYFSAYGRRYEDAIKQLEATLAMDAALDHARSVLGRTYLRLGDTERAIEEFERRRTITIGSVADLPAAHALAGNRDKAIAGLRRLLATARKRYVSPYDVATIYAALGNTHRALNWLERAVEFRDPTILLAAIDPALDSLRADPRFVNLVVSLARTTV
jgi:tetratricopeptide (TPR) repeat protein